MFGEMHPKTKSRKCSKHQKKSLEHSWKSYLDMIFFFIGNLGTPRIKISCLWFNNRRLARIEWQARQTFAFCEWVENGKRQRETRKRVHGIDLFICITFHFVWSVFWLLDCRDLGYWALYLKMNNDGEARFAVTPSFVLTHSSDSI